MGLTRFRDPGGRDWRYMGRVLVRCPSCTKCAVVLRPEIVDRRYAGKPRLTCMYCGLARVSESRSHIAGVPVDPFFQLPLWLQAPCCGHTLWAYNAEHLGVLERYVAAGLRERQVGRSSYTMLEVLPTWMKSRKHRGEVLRAVSRLRQSLVA